MEAGKLKKRILLFLFLSKILSLLFIWFLTSTYGFTSEQALSAVMLILPLFTVYLGIIVEDLVKNPYRENGENKTKHIVKPELKTLVNIIFPIYTLMILSGVFMGAQKTLPLETTIGIIESGFGFYIGKIVVSLFRTPQKPS